MEIIPDNIPQELKERKQWIITNDQIENPESWMTFDEACDKVDNGYILYFYTENDPYTIVAVDTDCDTLKPLIRSIADKVNTYCEKDADYSEEDAEAYIMVFKGKHDFSSIDKIYEIRHSVLILFTGNTLHNRDISEDIKSLEDSVSLVKPALDDFKEKRKSYIEDMVHRCIALCKTIDDQKELIEKSLEYAYEHDTLGQSKQDIQETVDDILPKVVKWVESRKPKPLKSRERKPLTKIMKKEFKDIEDTVEGFISSEGLTLIAGWPKIGKSYWTLYMAISMAKGEKVFGKIPVEKHRVLYLDLESTDRRIQNRIYELEPDYNEEDSRYDNFEAYNYVDDEPWHGLNDNGLEEIKDWLDNTPGKKIVFIDTWGAFRAGHPVAASEAYDRDYSELSQLKKLADKHKTPIVVVTHLREKRGEDPLHQISGSAGVPGTVDTAMCFYPKPNKKMHVLVRSRDLNMNTYEFVGNNMSRTWTLVGTIDDESEKDLLDTLHPRFKKIVEFIKNSKDSDISRQDIKKHLLNTEPGLTDNQLDKTLRKLVQNDYIENTGRGKYSIPNSEINEADTVSKTPPKSSVKSSNTETIDSEKSIITD